MKKLSRKEIVAQKALVHTINEFLRQGKITLDPNQSLDGPQIIHFNIGNVPAIASAADIGHGELSIHLALWPTPLAESSIRAWIPSASTRLKMGGFYTAGWLERKNGAWLQSSRGFSQTSCKSGMLQPLEALPWEEAMGFSPVGAMIG